MVLKAGTRVRIVDKNTHHHCFEVGSVAVSLGVGFGSGDWTKFKLEGSEYEVQFLLEEHYQIIADAKDEMLPTKTVYAVTDSSNNVMATTADREYARDLKAALGGKRKGMKIFKYEAVKEIR